MLAFVNTAVPFVIIGNKSAITDQQIAEEPQWMDFIRAFKSSFERDDMAHCWYFMPTSDPKPHTPEPENAEDRAATQRPTKPVSDKHDLEG